MKAFAHGIVETVRHPLLVLDAVVHVVVANASFYRTFGSGSSATVGHDFFEIDGGRWDQPRLRTLLKEVTFTAQPGLFAECDPAFIRVVLENLLGNAWKFTSKNPTATITFQQTKVAGRPAFIVRDDGAGFDMAFAGKMFGAFQRLHSDREFTGTGIGLATVQRVVRRHGGENWAEGAVGRGAALFFTLPGPEDHHP
jgi:light-regulated signal transduction histidine kinase (bacteriophytochrome)